MRDIKVWMHIGFPGTKYEDIITIEDDATEEDIEKEWFDWACQFIDGGWEENKNE